jgi:hypothetical protein
VSRYDRLEETAMSKPESAGVAAVFAGYPVKIRSKLLRA